MPKMEIEDVASRQLQFIVDAAMRLASVEQIFEQRKIHLKQLKCT
jgi:hypothetical protein